MTASSRNVLDLTRDLSVAARMGASHEEVNTILRTAIGALGKLVPFDLATVMEMHGDELHVRVACGESNNPAVEKHRLRLSEFPGIRSLMRVNRARAFTAEDHSDGDGDAFDGVLDLPHGHSCMVVPLKGHDRTLGIMTFDRKTCGIYPDSVVELAEIFGKLLAMAISFGGQSAILSRLGEQMQEQNRLLGERVRGRTDACTLMEASRNQDMIRTVRLAQQVAPTTTPVLITGETGTGKEVLANAVHGWSHRAGRPLVSINCAALPPNLIESELFGHVKGAFSGATGNRIGRFQTANGGTLFLDEIGELPLELQAKFLRALQEGCFEPVGSDRTVRVDVRIIAATNTDLVSALADRKFRDDLYYRLAVFPIHLPPLRERKEDIATISLTFLEALSRRTGRGPWHLSERSLEHLESRPWPGNVRELVNSLERATILSTGAELELDAGTLTHVEQEDHPKAGDGGEGPPLATLEEMERRHIRCALQRTSGKLYGADGAASILGINPNTLRSRMKKLGLGGARSFRITE